MALHHFATKLCDTQVDATWTQACRGILTHSILSQTGCSIRSSCHISSNQDEQFVECHLVIVIIRDIKLQLTVIDRNKWVIVLSTRLPSLVSSSNCKSSHARIAPRSMLGMSRRKHGTQLPAWSVQVQPQQHGIADLNRFIINA